MTEIEKPNFMKNAGEGKGHNLILEMLIAFVIFLVGDVLVGILQVLPTLVFILSDKDYIKSMLLNSLDVNAITEIVGNMPPWLIACSLISEVGLIAIYMLYCRFMEKRKINSMGFVKKDAVKKWLSGAALGGIAFLTAYGICVVTGSISFLPESGNGFHAGYLVLFLVGFLIQGLAEEVISKGYLLVSLSKRYPVFVSVQCSAIFFAILHSANDGMTILSYLNLYLFGVVTGLLFVRYESIWLVGALHGVWNFMQGNVFGIQVSGMNLLPSLFTTEYQKAKWINGGSFGIEGGLAVTLVLVVLVFLIWKNMEKNGRLIGAVQSVVSNQEERESQNHTFQERKSSVSNETESVRHMVSEEAGEVDAKPNMGLRPDETPWYPAESKENGKEEKTITEFDRSYFKD